MSKRIKENNKGFSLVELIVVIAIMAVLVGVLAPTLISNIEKSRESKDIQTLDSVASAVQVALGDEKGNEEAMKTYKDKNTTLEALLSADDSFATLVKENLGNKSIEKFAANCKCGSGTKTLYVNISEDGSVTAFYSNAEVPTAFSATKSKNPLTVTR